VSQEIVDDVFGDTVPCGEAFESGDLVMVVMIDMSHGESFEVRLDKTEKILKGDAFLGVIVCPESAIVETILFVEKADAKEVF
jgi:hypothetical protein